MKPEAQMGCHSVVAEKRDFDILTHDSSNSEPEQKESYSEEKKIKLSEKPTVDISCTKIEAKNKQNQTNKPSISNLECTSEEKKKESKSSFDLETWFNNPIDPVPEYYIEEGLRKVKPYYYVYTVNAKGRWIGRSLIDVFLTEFQDQPPEYYVKAIEEGRIRINKKCVKSEATLKHKDVIHHLIHRHEPPVDSTHSISILHQSENLVVVNKPSGMPVHPAGRYRFNTLKHILSNDFGIKKFFPANRLDRLTSGIVLIAQNPETARSLEEQMRADAISKSYYSRVAGKFPEEKLICDQPIKTLSHKLGLNHVNKEEGKPSVTHFELVNYRESDNTSLLRCHPKTGRTHQIRVHLLHLGFPIVNDPLYQLDSLKIEDGEVTNIYLSKSKRNAEEKTGGEGWTHCTLCGSHQPPDPKPEARLLFLHAFTYKGSDWTYTTPVLPDWIE